MLSHSLMPSGIVIPFIRKQVLWTFNCGLGALDNNGFQSRIQKLGVVDIGPGHNHTQWTACLSHKNASRGLCFALIGGVSTNQVPPNEP